MHWLSRSFSSRCRSFSSQVQVLFCQCFHAGQHALKRTDRLKLADAAAITAKNSTAPMTNDALLSARRLDSEFKRVSRLLCLGSVNYVNISMLGCVNPGALRKYTHTHYTHMHIHTRLTASLHGMPVARLSFKIAELAAVIRCAWTCMMLHVMIHDAMSS